MSQGLSLVHGPRTIPLKRDTLGNLLRAQANTYGDHAAIISWTGQRLSYQNLYERSIKTAKALLALGVHPGDHIGIYAENCERYVELLFATALISTTCVVLNCNYTAEELVGAIKSSDCKWLFTSTHIHKRELHIVLEALAKVFEQPGSGLQLHHVILIRPKGNKVPKDNWVSIYDDFIHGSGSIPDDRVLEIANKVDVNDVCNMQFTSGTTGNPKATMLTHFNLRNNGQFIGDRMYLKPDDIICCPPPLFHCFGLVLGLLACITHGSTFVIPSAAFDPVATMDSIIAHNCTGLHGVPTMYIATMQEHEKRGSPPISLRVGIAAGASVPRSVVERLQATFGLPDIVNVYGMTETSPASFMSRADDSVERKLTTVGTILPHTSAKIIDASGTIVPRGVRGEMCVTGYLLQKGYYKNEAKTAEVMKNEDGVVWMHTGDEAVIDEAGYCSVTGRIKDMIIRGGENIFPLEIEERLMLHPSVSMASVIGLHDEHYGEVVTAFLLRHESKALPSNIELQDFVRSKLGRHKAPVHIFWVGHPSSIQAIPMTASGKIQKNKLRDWGNLKLEARARL